MGSGFAMRFRTLWHDWVPVALVCGSVVSSIAGAAWWVASDRADIKHSIDELQSGQKELKDTQGAIVFKLDRLSANQEKVLFVLHIPNEPSNYYTFPPQIGKHRSSPFTLQAEPEGPLGKTKEPHSLYTEPEPMYAQQQPVQDAKGFGTQ